MTTAFGAEDWYPELAAEIDEAMTLDDLMSMDEIDAMVEKFSELLAGLTAAPEVEYP
jgi:hypothetical protein